MLETKFRAWDRIKCKMIYDFIIHSSGSWFDIYTTCLDTYHCGAQEYGLQRKYSIDKSLIMQFTTLYDKNKKEIWENDIVRDWAGNVYIVKWYENGWWLFNNNEPIKLVGNIGLEVIGNIYET